MVFYQRIVKSHKKVFKNTQREKVPKDGHLGGW